MTSIDYARSTGRRLTYRIRVDQRGQYVISLAGKFMLRGCDPWAEKARSGARTKRTDAGAIQLARQAIESLQQMTEI